VLRKANPKLDDSANDLNPLPTAVGSSYGLAPTATTTPTTVSTTKYARWRHRTHAAAKKASTGSAKLTTRSQRSRMYGTLASVQWPRRSMP
jgi:hypothetical protein